MLSFFVAVGFSQKLEYGQVEKDSVSDNTNGQPMQGPDENLRLEYVKDSIQEAQIAEKEELLQFAIEMGWDLEIPLDSNGGKMVLIGWDKDTLPIYRRTFNLKSSNTIRSSNARDEFGLTGEGVVIGVWDEGMADGKHEEFGGRVDDMYDETIYGDEADLSQHSTHVAGTICASGVDPRAAGMAPGAKVISYNWDDNVLELLTETLDGMVLSNHSYGSMCGWDWDAYGNVYWMGNTEVDEWEDYKFGYYGEEDQEYDLLTYYDNTHLMLFAAGNDRNNYQVLQEVGWAPSDGYVVEGMSSYDFVERSPDGDYDCIGTGSVAKNIMCVGAIEPMPFGYTSAEDVVSGDFSSWGPVDDGRIKPDISACGVDVYSTLPGGDYDSFQGTSMATPAVTGSLALLQELAKDVRGAFLWATSIKALAIHGAEEAGHNDGPDYSFGWGVMNTRRSAEVLNTSDTYRILEERSLRQDEVETFTFEVTEQNDIRFTLVWNDPPYAPVEEVLDDRTPNLVNDLNLLVSKDGESWYPWKLDPERPEKAATQGVNHVDNVERIDIYTAEPGTYMVKVSHEGDLKDGIQTFSLIGSYIYTDNASSEYAYNDVTTHPGGNHGGGGKPGRDHGNDNDDDDYDYDNDNDSGNNNKPGRGGGNNGKPGQERPTDEQLSEDAINYLDGYWDIVAETAELQRGEVTYGEIWVSVENTGSRDIEVTVEFDIGYFCPNTGNSDYELSEVTFIVPAYGSFEETYNYEFEHKRGTCGPDVYLNDMRAIFR